jgi:signal transduction histidine kinase
MKQPKRPSEYPKARRNTVLPKINTDEDDGGEGADGDSRSGATETSIAVAHVPTRKRRHTVTVMAGLDEGQVFPIEGNEVWIGRGDDCTIVLTDRGVSRKHACVVRRDSGVYLKDNEAKNGTFVNNRRIAEQELQTGDEIQLGPNLCLLFSDITFGENVHSGKLARRTAREKLLADKIQRERVESIASMVAGVAHEINTPLGVANTANAMIAALAEEVRRDPTSEKIDELLADLRASTGLVSKNLERASQLVQTFKQLSTHELADERLPCDLRAIVDECVGDLKADLARRGINVRLTFKPEADEFPWLGFQKSLRQVILQLFENVFRHAYEDGSEGGTVDIRVVQGRAARAGSGYRLEFEDYGAGLPQEIVARMFEPFVTPRREKSGIGLGLAIVRNIVTNLLGGTIRCTSQRGTGTQFVIVLPREVPLDLNED